MIKPEHGRVINDPEQLKITAAEAVKLKEYPRATHMYTLAIDLLLENTKSVAAPDTSTTDKDDKDDKAEPKTYDWRALDAKSNGLLHVLLSNRSFTQYRCNDYLAAAEDAEHCVQCSPTFVKGWLRLLAAIAEGTKETNHIAQSVTDRARIIARGLRANPGSKPLMLAREALVKEASVEVVLAVEADEAKKLREQLQMTKVVADDASDARHIMAAGDYGSALAVGAHGLEKNVEEAEKYLNIGSKGGDAASAKNYGHLLLKLNRAGEASAQFARAAELGDPEAEETLRSLGVEADVQREEAMNKLRTLAEGGHPQAIEMLKEFSLAFSGDPRAVKKSEKNQKLNDVVEQ